MDSADVLGIVVLLFVCEAMMCGGDKHSIIWRAAAWLQDYVDSLDRHPENIPVLADEEESTPVEENTYAEEDSGRTERQSWKL
jgi:hypothetical protein